MSQVSICKRDADEGISIETLMYRVCFGKWKWNFESGGMSKGIVGVKASRDVLLVKGPSQSRSTIISTWHKPCIYPIRSSWSQKIRPKKAHLIEAHRYRSTFEDFHVSLDELREFRRTRPCPCNGPKTTERGILYSTRPLSIFHSTSPTNAYDAERPKRSHISNSRLWPHDKILGSSKWNLFPYYPTSWFCISPNPQLVSRWTQFLASKSTRHFTW